MVAEFIRFYGYTADQVLDEFAVRFFGFLNSMYQLKAKDNIVAITNAAAAASSSGQEVISNYKKQARGLPGVLEEVRTVKP